VPAPRLVSLKGSDFTGLGIECYGGLKDGIYVKKVAPQGPASGHINIGEFVAQHFRFSSNRIKFHFVTLFRLITAIKSLLKFICDF
jgi:hypothetical protein